MASLAGQRGHNYGSINISDTATAILGNQYMAGDSWHIGSITVNLQNDDASSIARLLHGVKRRLLTDHQEELSRTQLQDVDGLEAGRPRKRLKQTLFTKLWTRSELGSDGLSSFDGSVPQAETVRGFLRPRKTNPNVPPRSSKAHTQDISEPSSDDSLMPNSDNSIATGMSSSMLPLVLVAGLMARNTSLDSVRLFLNCVQNDPLSLLVATILGCWMMNFFNSIRGRSLSEMSGDCVWFEDVYQMRVKIPIACLSDSQMLSNSFSSHYRSTSAEQFVADRQYNLFAGGRDGTPTTMEELCSTLGVKEVFMAMLYRASFDTCLNCSNKISPYKFLSEGLQRCDYCRRQYRISFNETAPRTSSMNTSSFLLPTWRQPESKARVDGLGGILNVDLNIQWKSHQNIGRLVETMQGSLKSWGSDAASSESFRGNASPSPFSARGAGTNASQRNEQDVQAPQGQLTAFTNLGQGLDDDKSWQRTSFEGASTRLDYPFRDLTDEDLRIIFVRAPPPTTSKVSIKSPRPQSDDAFPEEMNSNHPSSQEANEIFSIQQYTMHIRAANFRTLNLALQESAFQDSLPRSSHS